MSNARTAELMVARMMNLEFGNDGGGDRRLCELGCQCNQLKLGGCQENRHSVKSISLEKKCIRNEPLLDPRNE
jgi:hypothetical protein